MHTSSLIFKLLGTIHGLAGALLLVLAQDKDLQNSCFYKGEDAFVGGLHKNLAFFGSALLIACGAFTFFRPIFAVGAAWLSFLIYLLPSLTHLMAGRLLGGFCKECVASFSARAVAFAALTTALLYG
jgi:hypothetical protein